MTNNSRLAGVWIKICGLTTAEGVAAAVAAEVNAVGFVFAPSKRQVSAARAAELARAVPTRIVRVAVMRHPSQALLDEVWSTLRPDVLQTDIEDFATLRLPAQLGVLPVVRGVQADAELPARVLFEGPASGTGEKSDWEAASRLARTRQLVLAGGLRADNVADAMKHVRPFGVDVSSGVEQAPGIKDPAKISEFVRRARAAANGVE